MSQILPTSLIYLSELYLYIFILVSTTSIYTLPLPPPFTFLYDGSVRGHTSSYATIVGAAVTDVSAAINYASDTTADSTVGK